MNILVSIDDTDNLESRGTGELASLLAAQIDEQGWGRSGFVTRHQLLVHPDIPYTSHNSAMCFTAVLDDGHLEHFIEHASRFLETESAPGSDPGLCVAPEPLVERETLVRFGRSAKQEVLTKEEAYALAEKLGIHLTEHGGSGQGVVGALAGAGLRMGGNDGRLKGRLEFGSTRKILPIRDLMAHGLVEEIRTPDGFMPPGDDLVRLDEKVKTVLLGGKSVLLLAPDERGEDGIRWRTFLRRELKKY